MAVDILASTCSKPVIYGTPFVCRRLRVIRITEIDSFLFLAHTIFYNIYHCHSDCGAQLYIHIVFYSVVFNLDAERFIGYIMFAIILEYFSGVMQAINIVRAGGVVAKKTVFRPKIYTRTIFNRNIHNFIITISCGPFNIQKVIPCTG